MSFDTNWDIDKHKEDHESDDHWLLRRNFMERWKQSCPEERLVCLGRVFSNIEFMGCRYPQEVMLEVARMSKEVNATDNFDARQSLDQDSATAKSEWLGKAIEATQGPLSISQPVTEQGYDIGNSNQRSAVEEEYVWGQYSREVMQGPVSISKVLQTPYSKSFIRENSLNQPFGNADNSTGHNYNQNDVQQSSSLSNFVNNTQSFVSRQNPENNISSGDSSWCGRDPRLALANIPKAVNTYSNAAGYSRVLNSCTAPPDDGRFVLYPKEKTYSVKFYKGERIAKEVVKLIYRKSLKKKIAIYTVGRNGGICRKALPETRKKHIHWWMDQGMTIEEALLLSLRPYQEIYEETLQGKHSHGTRISINNLLEQIKNTGNLNRTQVDDEMSSDVSDVDDTEIMQQEVQSMNCLSSNTLHPEQTNEPNFYHSENTELSNNNVNVQFGTRTVSLSQDQNVGKSNDGNGTHITSVSQDQNMGENYDGNHLQEENNYWSQHALNDSIAISTIYSQEESEPNTNGQNTFVNPLPPQYYRSLPMSDNSTKVCDKTYQEVGPSVDRQRRGKVRLTQAGKRRLHFWLHVGKSPAEARILSQTRLTNFPEYKQFKQTFGSCRKFAREYNKRRIINKTFVSTKQRISTHPKNSDATFKNWPAENDSNYSFHEYGTDLSSNVKIQSKQSQGPMYKDGNRNTTGGIVVNTSEAMRNIATISNIAAATASVSNTNAAAAVSSTNAAAAVSNTIAAAAAVSNTYAATAAVSSTNAAAAVSNTIAATAAVSNTNAAAAVSNTNAATAYVSNAGATASNTKQSVMVVNNTSNNTKKSTKSVKAAINLSTKLTKKRFNMWIKMGKTQKQALSLCQRRLKDIPMVDKMMISPNLVIQKKKKKKKAKKTLLISPSLANQLKANPELANKSNYLIKMAEKERDMDYATKIPHIINTINSLRPKTNETNKASAVIEISDSENGDNLSTSQEGIGSSVISCENTEKINENASQLQIFIKDPNKIIQRAEIYALKGAISKCIGDNKEISMPSVGRRVGCAVLNCVDVQSRDWLDKEIPTLLPWEGAQLEIINEIDIPQPYNAWIFVPIVPETGPANLEPDDLLEKINQQNPGVGSENWKIISREVKEGGQHLLIHVDEKTEHFLKTHGNRLNWFNSIRTINISVKTKLLIKKKKVVNPPTSKTAKLAPLTTLSQKDSTHIAKDSPHIDTIQPTTSKASESVIDTKNASTLIKTGDPSSFNSWFTKPIQPTTSAMEKKQVLSENIVHQQEIITETRRESELLKNSSLLSHENRSDSRQESSHSSLGEQKSLTLEQSKTGHNRTQNSVDFWGIDTPRLLPEHKAAITRKPGLQNANHPQEDTVKRLSETGYSSQREESFDVRHNKYSFREVRAFDGREEEYSLEERVFAARKQKYPQNKNFGALEQSFSRDDTIFHEQQEYCRKNRMIAEQGQINSSKDSNFTGPEQYLRKVEGADGRNHGYSQEDRVFDGEYYPEGVLFEQVDYSRENRVLDRGGEHSRDDNILVGQDEEYSRNHRVLVEQDEECYWKDRVLDRQGEEYSRDERVLAGRDEKYYQEIRVLVGRDKDYSRDDRVLVGRDEEYSRDDRVLVGRDEKYSRDDKVLVGLDKEYSRDDRVLVGRDEECHQRDRVLDKRGEEYSPGSRGLAERNEKKSWDGQVLERDQEYSWERRDTPAREQEYSREERVLTESDEVYSRGDKGRIQQYYQEDRVIDRRDHGRGSTREDKVFDKRDEEYLREARVVTIREQVYSREARIFSRQDQEYYPKDSGFGKRHVDYRDGNVVRKQSPECSRQDRVFAGRDQYSRKDMVKTYSQKDSFAERGQKYSRQERVFAETVQDYCPKDRDYYKRNDGALSSRSVESCVYVEDRVGRRETGSDTNRRSNDRAVGWHTQGSKRSTTSNKNTKKKRKRTRGPQNGPY